MTPGPTVPPHCPSSVGSDSSYPGAGPWQSRAGRQAFSRNAWWLSFCEPGSTPEGHVTPLSTKFSPNPSTSLETREQTFARAAPPTPHPLSGGTPGVQMAVGAAHGGQEREVTHRGRRTAPSTQPRSGTDGARAKLVVMKVQLETGAR